VPVVPLGCLGVFLLVWTALAIAPVDRADWLLENLPVFLAVPLAVGTYRRFRFSDVAYVQATLFALLHALGSHYTYSEVPLGWWVAHAAGLARNHYDRFVHFSFGLLMFRPIAELALREVRGRVARVYLGVAAVALWSVSYEAAEWLVARVADPAAGTAYLGTQGDEWDAQKDMALACLGGLVAALVDAGVGRARGRAR
jgi:putative membrane protein